MPPQIKFSGNIISVIDQRRICIRLDKECVERISMIISAVNDKTTYKDTIIVNVNECRFNIKNIDWNELHNLIGVHVSIVAQPRPYSFWRTKDIIDDNEMNRKINVKYRGVSIIAKQLTNILE